MTRVSTAIRVDPDAKLNARLINLTTEFKGRDNAAFLARVAELLDQESRASPAGSIGIDPGGVGCIGLMGEYGMVGYSIRHAQSLVRLDQLPSYWSHCFLITGALSSDNRINRSRRQSAWIWESTLEPPTPFNHFIERNGVSARRIADYARSSFDLLSEHCVPNMAVIAIGLTPAEREAILERADRPDVDQLAYDLAALLGTWYAYVTDRANKPNPLVSSQAVYCSAYLQLAYDAAGIDLAPGAHERNTSPEHIWQTARYLYPSLTTTDPATQQVVNRQVVGWYCIRDHIGSVAPLDLEEPFGYASLRKATHVSA